MKTIGRHLIAEYYGCDRERIDQTEAMREALLAAAAAIGVTVVGEAFHRYAPQGVSGVLLIAESHISIHTWPEYGYAAADIFTCGTSFHPQVVADLLIEKVECQDPYIHEVQRGMIPQVVTS